MAFSLADLGSRIGNFFQGLVPTQTSTFNYAQPAQANPPSSRFIGSPQQMQLTIGHPAQAPVHPVATPIPTQMPHQAPQQAPPPQNMTDLGERIRAGYRAWNGGQPVPMEQYIPQMVQATQQYPIFQQNPYLIPAVSIVETGAGKNWKLNHNPLSWAARIQQAGGYSPQSDEQSIMDMITAVGGAPGRGVNASYYDKFRQSNNLQDFATTYESPSNTAYYPALQNALGYFK